MYRHHPTVISTFLIKVVTHFSHVVHHFVFHTSDSSYEAGGVPPAGACARGPVRAHLQADGQVDPAAEGGAHGPRVEAEVFEELGEGVSERHPGPLLRHHHAGPDAGQVQPPSL